MRHILPVLMGLLLHSTAVADSDRLRRDVPPETFAIFPWGRTPTDASALVEMKEAGFNVAGFVAAEGLDAVAAAGLKAIVADPSTAVSDGLLSLPDGDINERVRALIDRVGSHPAVFGYYVRDEPAAKAFEALANWSAAFRSMAPNAVAYINLFPNYASPVGTGFATYEEYVDTFVTGVRPAILSFDNYSLMDDGSLRPGYFANMEVIRAAALRYRIPFWAVILSNAHFRYAEPSAGGLAFQAFAALAYGARGLGYYTYFTPKTGNYRSAPIDQFGHKTLTWQLVRRLNLQILTLAPVLTQLESVNVFHHPHVPPGSIGLDRSRFIAGVSGGDLLIGEFQGQGARPFVLVVNKDLHRSTSFRVRFKLPGRVVIVNSYSGEIQEWTDLGGWLAPGQGMVLTLADPT